MLLIGGFLEQLKGFLCIGLDAISACIQQTEFILRFRIAAFGLEPQIINLIGFG